MNYSFSLDFLADKTGDILAGIAVTLQLALAANVIGVVCGFIVCLLAMSRWKLLRLPARTFIELFRCTPALLQIVWIFYCVPILFDVFIDPIPMGILALGLNLTAFNAEAYRAGVQTVPREQLDACIALGLARWQRTVYVVLPQAVRIATPVLITNGIGILQQSALVAIVAVGDLMTVGRDLASQSFRPIETYTLVALIYLLLSLPVARLASAIERRQDRASVRSEATS